MGKKTVLIVEDNDLNLRLAADLLKMAQFHVLEAVDAEHGLQVALEELPDLILMDIQLPKMDGLTATRIIKKDPALRQIPVVAVTGYAMVGDEEVARRAGCCGYITKPIDTRSFAATVAGFLKSDADPGSDGRQGSEQTRVPSYSIVTD